MTELTFTIRNSEETMWATLPDGREIYVEQAVYDRAPVGQRCFASYWLRLWKTGKFEDPENEAPVQVCRGRLRQVPILDPDARAEAFYRAQMADEQRRANVAIERLLKRRARFLRPARPVR